MKDTVNKRKIAYLRQKIESQHRTQELLLRALEGPASPGRTSGLVTIGPRLSKNEQARSITLESRPTQSTPWWPAIPLPKKALRPPPGLTCYTLDSGQVSAIAIPVFGREGEALRQAVAQISEVQRRGKNLIPVFLTDSSEHDVFRRSGHAFQYFPKAIYGSEDGLLLFQEKLQLAWRKWNISTMIDLSAPDYLAPRIQGLDLPSRTSTKLKDFDPTKRAPTLPPVPTPDIAALKAEYFGKGLDQEPDHFILYRVIGNDLYPRHVKGQTRENLRFILENEPSFENCEKRWVVNRIFEPDEESSIIALLDQHGQQYIHIPFVLAEYGCIQWDLESFPQPAFFMRGRYDGMDDYDSSRAKVHARRHKNNYVMNNNGARNAALRDGRGRAKWVLPWDGNCFLTEVGWAEIVTTVTERPYLKYFVVPMARCTDNSALLDPCYMPEPADEPQVLFRKDAQEEFDEHFCYGRRPKVELLWRLGVPGDWDTWRDDVWDLSRPEQAEEAGAFGWSGWVARLFSGQEELEVVSGTSLRGRGLARNAAITATLDKLDENAARQTFDPQSLTVYEERAIAALAQAPYHTPQGSLFGRLLQEADLALQRGPYSVVDKTSLPPSGDPHDYWHAAPYWWPNSHSADGLPYEFRDGERVPGTRLNEPDSDRYDRTRLQRFFNDTTILALAWKASGKLHYAERAAELVHRWFVAPETLMNPHLRFAQVVLGQNDNEGSRTGIIEMKDLYFFLDAVRLLERAEVISSGDRDALRQWLESYLEWLQTSPQGVEERKADNNHGTCYDLQVGSIAAFLGNVPLLLSTFRDSRERLLEQFDRKGSQPQELARTLTAHYCCFNLQSWINLANLAASCGDRLWDFAGGDGRGLARGLEWLLPFMAKEDWPYQQIEPFDRDRFLPLYFAGRDRYAQPEREAGAPCYRAKPLFFPHDGIKPFWMLGSGDVAAGSEGECDKIEKVFRRLNRHLDQSSRIASTKTHSKSPPARYAKKLEAKLWGGFSEYAVDDLEALKRSRAASPQEVSYAAWALARWYAVENEPERALENAVMMRRADQKMSNFVGQVLLEADCLTKLGDNGRAQTLLSAMLEGQPFEPHLCLAMANTFVPLEGPTSTEADEQRLAWINRIYHAAGLLPLEKADPNRPLAIDNLAAAERLNIDTEDLPKVSVVMPLFNAEATLEFALRGLTQQTLQNLEIIVVDDCSTDHSLAVAQRLACRDPRIIVIRQEKNQGAYAARNRALQLATGDYITTHDADDWSHAQKLETQLRRLLVTPEKSANYTWWVRAYQTLYFSGPYRPGSQLLMSNISSLMMARSAIMDLGGWDNVRIAADTELLRRIYRREGPDSVEPVLGMVPLSFALGESASLTRGSRTHIKTQFHGVRREYHSAAEYWHSTTDPDGLYIDPISPGRPFPAPGTILARPDNILRCDLLIIMDFNLSGGSFHSTMNYVYAAISRGYSVGIFHWRRYDADVTLPLNSELRRMAHEGKLRIVAPGEAVRASTAIVGYPTILQWAIDLCPKIECDDFIVVCNQMAERYIGGDDVQYAVQVVDQRANDISGRRAIWVPISDLVRHRMEGDSLYPVPHFENWTPLLDTMKWCENPLRWRGGDRERPVVGRHGRDHVTKWPSNAEFLRAAYCADRPCDVVFLGGADHALRVIGEQPRNWTVHEFNSLDTREFLLDLDFFVHHPHEQYIEEFGRAPMEAMAVGCPVILPPVFRETFGDAALYAEPAEVWPTIEALWCDEAIYLSQAKAGREFVLANCGWDQLPARLNRLKASRSARQSRHSKLDAHRDWLLALIGETPDMTINEMKARLSEERGVAVATSTIWKFLDRRGLTFKKSRRTRRRRIGPTS